jgi:hypothetical protein
LKIKGKCENDNWLWYKGKSNNDNEWLFVIWTKVNNSESIVQNRLKVEQRNKFGIGIYSTIILTMLKNILQLLEIIKLFFKIQLNLELLKYEDLMIIGMLLMEVNSLYTVCIKKV